MINPITQLLLCNNLKDLKLDNPYLSTLGNITGVGRKGFEVEDGEGSGNYTDLEEYDLANLLYDVQVQIMQPRNNF